MILNMAFNMMANIILNISNIIINILKDYWNIRKCCSIYKI